MARTIRWLLRALYAPPQRKAVPKTEEVDLKVLEDQIWDAIEWLSEWHPKKDDDDNQAQEWIDWLDESLHLIDPSSEIFNVAVHEYLTLCRRADRVPAVCFLSGNIVLETVQPLHQTALSDVYRGIKDTVSVALKSLRIHGDDKEKVQKAFLSEVAMWRCLRHPNIVPFLGVSTIFPVCLVSEWMASGSISSFLLGRAGESRLKYVKDVLSGLSFMHSLDIVHGDMKAANILVDANGNACLTDFGLAKALESSGTLTGTSTMRGTLRWMAPELLMNDGSDANAGQPTSASDMYATAMVIWELFTGRVPFDELRHDYNIYGRVLGGERPPRPADAEALGLSDDLWDCMECCWQKDPNDRLSCQVILDVL